MTSTSPDSNRVHHDGAGKGASSPPVVAAMEMEPVRRSHSDARRTYDWVSRVYDPLEGSFEKRVRTGGVALLAVRPGERVLDLGFGTGVALVDLARRAGTDGFVTGVDPSRGMHNRARRRLDRSASRPALVLGDAMTLPYQDACFDAVFMSFVLELFATEEIPTVLAEVRRVLRPGGRVGVVALGVAARPGVMSRLYLWGHRRFPRVLDCRPIPTRRLLADAGFRVTGAANPTMWRLPVDVVVAQSPQ